MNEKLPTKIESNFHHKRGRQVANGFAWKSAIAAGRQGSARTVPAGHQPQQIDPAPLALAMT
jgi:hypothetical protein